MMRSSKLDSVGRRPEVPVLDLAPELAEVSADLESAWRRVLESGTFILGPEVEAFEREAAGYLGVKHAVGVNSGTDALVIALRAQGVGPGDEVVTSPFTFFATAESISAVGAAPVFVDIDPESFTIRPELVEQAITPRTKAILPVHLFGHAADMDHILAIARTRGLAVIEDAAQAFGGTCGERKVGTLGAAGAFSFFPSKNLGAIGDAGLIVTNDDHIADSARMLRGHGSRRKYYNETIGYNSRIDALQAAFLRAKLPRVDAWNALRRAAAARYRELLAGIPWIVPPFERRGVGHVFHQFTVRVLERRRDALRDALVTSGIGTMVYYPKPLHELPVYQGMGFRCGEAEKASREVLSLPIWPHITPEIQERVAAAIRNCHRP
jgi:dTDP-4-amino-4,6-dideoxygalactose transaminase